MVRTPYHAPRLVDYGTLVSLTRGGTPGCDPDGGSGMSMVSDVNLKENVLLISF